MWYTCFMYDNGFWKVCEALDCVQRIKLLRYLLSVEKTEFPCVSEIAHYFYISCAATSIHLKQLANAGLVVSKRSDRRVYYRAFAANPTAERVLDVVRHFLAAHPDTIDNRERLFAFLAYVRALSHPRRHAIIRCLAAEPGLDIKTLAVRTDMPPQTADRLLNDLDRAHIVDLTGRVVPPPEDPEATLLDLTLA